MRHVVSRNQEGNTLKNDQEQKNTQIRRNSIHLVDTDDQFPPLSQKFFTEFIRIPRLSSLMGGKSIVEELKREKKARLKYHFPSRGAIPQIGE